MSSFPKILHRVWLGTRARPAVYDSYWDEWRHLNPEWQLMTWTERDLDSLDWPDSTRRVWNYLEQNGAYGGIQMDAARAMAVQKADILGYLILANCGGVYLNCDMQPLRPLADLFAQAPPGMDSFAGHEDDHYLCNAVMGSVPNGRMMLSILGELTEARVRANPQMEVATGPHLLTSVYYAAGGKGSNLWSLPRETFYYAHHGMIPYGQDAASFEYAARAKGAIALHHWGHRTQEGQLGR
jgi:mannosyltransferase OCH1-like enzyme